jgi:hypothetical protein
MFKISKPHLWTTPNLECLFSGEGNGIVENPRENDEAILLLNETEDLKKKIENATAEDVTHKHPPELKGLIIKVFVILINKLV